MKYTFRAKQNLLKATALVVLFLCFTGTYAQDGNAEPLVTYSFNYGTESDDSGLYTFTLRGGATIVATDDGNGALYTGSDDGWADLGSAVGTDIVATLSGDYTISIDLCVEGDNSLSSYCWAWAFSNSTSTYLGLINSAGNDAWYYEIKNSSAYSANSNTGLTTDEWHTLTIVQEGDTLTLYIDGEAKVSRELTVRPGDFSALLDDNYLGRSPYSSDAYMTNTLMDNLKVYNTALTAEQVAELSAAKPTSCAIVYDADYILDAAREELYLAQAARYIHNTLTLPTSCSYGDVEWEYIPYETSTSATIDYTDGTFNVTARADEAVTVGQLQGTFTYEGITYNVFTEPVEVTVAPDDNAYGYLYCHMPNLVPDLGTGTLVSQVITYALGTEDDKGLVFNELNRGHSIIDGIGTDLPWCRDAFMAKDKQRNCWYIVTTDLYDSADEGTSMLLNYSIGMFKSYDLINWTYSRQDMKEYLTANPPTDIYDNTGTQLLTADKVSRVWAPQIIFIDGDAYIYYAVGNTDNDDCDHFYISKANDDFTAITSFQMLYGANKVDNVLDADIKYLETDSLYHMSYRDYAEGDIRDITTEDLLNPVWSDPVTSFTDGSGYEASSVFRRINDDTWNVGNVNYSSDIGFHFHTADAMLRNLQSADDMTGHLSPQHGSFVYVTQTEYEILQAWSDLKALITDATELLLTTDDDDVLQSLAAQAQTDITTDNNSSTVLETLHATLQSDVTNLGARLRLSQALYRAKKANFTGIEGHESALDNELNGGALTQAIADAQASSETSDATLWDTQADALNEATTTFFKAVKAAGEEEEVKNGDFSNGDNRWTVDGSLTVSSGVAQFYASLETDYTVSLKQTQRSLEQGYYLAYCQAFERNGDNDHSGRDYQQGVELINYSFFFGEDTVKIQSLYSVPDESSNALYGFANTMSAASTLFSASEDNFANYILVYIEEDHSRASIGLERIESTVTSSDWCCFDNIKLYKIDNPATSVTTVKKDTTAIAHAPVYDVSGILRGSTNTDGELPTSLQKGIYIVNEQKIVKKD